jgi:hypothetical protein
MRTRSLIFSVVTAAVVLVGGAHVLWAQPPDIDIDLIFDDPSLYFAFGEPIALEAVVRSEPGIDIWISEGFSRRVFYRQLRIIDPSGRQLLAKLNPPSPAPPDSEPSADQFPIEAPDAPAYPWRQVGNTLIRAGFCEVLPPGWTSEPWQERAEDIRDYYDISLPGYYSAQVQVAVKVFKGSDCDLEDYQWEGLLKSETVYFYVEGATQVNIEPDLWRIVWQEGEFILPNVKVVIWPQNGQTVDAYQKESIRLNNVAAREVLKLYSVLKKQHYLLAFFNKEDAINSLGEVQVGQWYPVEISGKTTSGKFFGGARRIKIVR